MAFAVLSYLKAFAISQRDCRAVTRRVQKVVFALFVLAPDPEPDHLAE